MARATKSQIRQQEKVEKLRRKREVACKLREQQTPGAATAIATLRFTSCFSGSWYDNSWSGANKGITLLLTDALKVSTSLRRNVNESQSERTKNLPTQNTRAH
jgi:hypothetical protein